MKIVSCFPGLPDNKNANLDDYSRYFLEYQKEYWDEFGGEGYFEYQSDNGDVILFFVDYFGKGVSLRYDYNIPSVKEGTCWYSVGEKEKMQEIVDADCDLFIPLGSCLSPEAAFSVISDFFMDPLNKSDKVKWVDADELDWSSVY